MQAVRHLAPVPRIDRVREQHLGARRLAGTIIRNCVKDIREARAALLDEDCLPDERRAALAIIREETGWLSSPAETPLSFTSLCEHLRLNGRLIRRQIARELAAVPGRGLRASIERLAAGA